MYRPDVDTGANFNSDDISLDEASATSHDHTHSTILTQNSGGTVGTVERDLSGSYQSAQKGPAIIVSKTPGIILSDAEKTITGSYGVLPSLPTANSTNSAGPTSEGKFMFGVGVNSEAGIIGNVNESERAPIGVAADVIDSVYRKHGNSVPDPRLPSTAPQAVSGDVIDNNTDPRNSPGVTGKSTSMSLAQLAPSSTADTTRPRAWGYYRTENLDVRFAGEPPLTHPSPDTLGDLTERRKKYLDADLSDQEQYDAIIENEFQNARKEPFSTFSVDVDTASYANIRRLLGSSQLPPQGAVRIEEMVNYFRYDYPATTDEHPFSVNMEVAQCPWNEEHRLLRVALAGQSIDRASRGPCNLVFLLDVSGSMQDDNKLPLVQRSMKMLVDELTEDDRVAIVTYAGEAGVKLQPTGGHDKQTLHAAIDSLQAEGSTNGSAGIQLAYDLAADHFVAEGANRVILATDGDLNVGITSDEALVELIQRRAAEDDIFLTVLGFGGGNLKDSKLEKLADHGNGIYRYVDNLREARRTLVRQMSGNLLAVAKDVKLQLDFNCAEIAAFRLIGYENRVLAHHDFENDSKDAGEIGAGHQVTAFYELVPAGEAKSSGPLTSRYQRVPSTSQTELTEAATSGDLLTLELRYKRPTEDISLLISEFTLQDEGKTFEQASEDFRFAASVAAFGMVLRDSAYRGQATLATVEAYATAAIGEDIEGDRAEFLDLVRQAGQLQR